MPQTDIGNTDTSALATAQKDWTVNTAELDGATDQKETRYQLEDWSYKFGYYKNIPELQAAIDAKATWTVGKGFKAEPVVELALSFIDGFGKDTFNTILENMIRTSHIAGDAYAEIIRDEQGRLANLKPLDPSTIVVVANRKGIIIRYEQVSKVNKKTDTSIKFKPEDIFHIARNRVGDEIHGQSLITAVEDIIKMRNEAMADMRLLMHRHVKPVTIYHLDTDDAAKISAFKAKADAANAKGENIYVPKGAVEIDMQSVAANATLNPLPWIETLNNYFFQATGVPDIIVGGSKSLTEASAKIAYLAFQQTIEEEQLFMEEQVLTQLGLEIDLEFPASLENELLSDKKKDGEETAAQPADTTATMEGRT